MHPAESPSVHPKIIFLVEDNPADVLLIREALLENGVDYESVLSRDGADAIRVLEEMESSDRHCPDVIILDLNIPKMHGLEVLRRVRRSDLCARTPVLVFSSSEAPSDRQGALDLGATVYMRKPFDLAEFMTLGSEVKRLLHPPTAVA